MFYRYEIKKNNNGEALYLFLNMKYEFSKELAYASSNEELTRRCKNLITNSGIDYQGDKVFLVIDGIIVKTLDLKDDIEILDEKKESDYSNDSFLVSIVYEDKTIIEISLKEYLLGVLASNAYLNLEIETLKALTLLYRTYAYKEMKEHGKISAINPFVSYKPISYYKFLWLNEFDSIYNRFESAITSTDKEFVTHNDEYILPFVHLSNNGYTSNSDEWEYLKKKASLWDYLSPYYLDINEYKYEEISKIFDCSIDDIKAMKILEVTDNNRIKKIKIGKHTYSGISFKNHLSLRSDDVTILIDHKRIRFITRGYGNSLGLSQFGANEMVIAGNNYTGVLTYYFNNIVLKRYR